MECPNCGHALQLPPSQPGRTHLKYCDWRGNVMEVPSCGVYAKRRKVLLTEKIQDVDCIKCKKREERFKKTGSEASPPSLPAKSET
jgi:ssDNA-binding Zn-finger/Zn-ribbon topoisomerase 1